MTSRQLIDKLDHACYEDNGTEVARLLASCPDKETLYRECDNAQLPRLAQFNCVNALRVIAALFPEKLNEPDDSGMTPLKAAMHYYSTEAMLELLQLGATKDDATVLQGIMGATRGNYYGSNDHPYLHLVAFRESGLEALFNKLNGTSVFSQHLQTREWEMIKRSLNAGAPLYATLKLPVPDPFNPDIKALRTAFCNQRVEEDDNLRYSTMIALMDYASRTVKEAPSRTSPLKPCDFLDEKGALHPQVYNWESVGLLSAYFSPEAVPQWSGGISEMLATADRFPACVREELNLQRLMRDTPTPHENSITVAYARSNLEERSVV